jgi:hypothetical protein
MPSDRKATAIYAAVHHRLVDLRISLKRTPPKSAEDLDTRVAKAMEEAADDAVTAYRNKLKRGA